MTGASEWTGRVGGSWAQEWRRTDRSFGEVTRRLLYPAALGPFARALDIGCGAGEISVTLAHRDPSSEITGLDISPALLDVARERGIGCPNLAFVEADAATWQPENGEQAPDLLISRHGVMFFADPVLAFTHLRHAATPDAALRFSCFREREANAWVGLLQGILPAPPPPPDPCAPGPFAFGDSARVHQILSDAGWKDIGFEAIDYAMIAGEGASALDEAVAYFLRIGLAAGAIAALEGKARDQAIADLRAMLAGRCADDRIALPAAAWIVTARAS